MAKKMLIDATHAEETRVVVVDGNKVEEFDFETQSRRQLAGNIYLAKVTRVEPSLQAAFVDYGGNRHGFLAFSEIHPDYYQIPVADREALIAEERAYAESLRDDDEGEEAAPKKRRSRSRSRSKAAETDTTDAVTTAEPDTREIEGMETIDLGDEGDETPEGSSPMELVADTPVETPDASETGSLDADTGEAQTADAAPAADSAEYPDAEPDAEDDAKGVDATAKDDAIESVADADDSDDIRPRRKPRPR